MEYTNDNLQLDWRDKLDSLDLTFQNITITTVRCKKCNDIIDVKFPEIFISHESESFLKQKFHEQMNILLIENYELKTRIKKLSEQVSTLQKEKQEIQKNLDTLMQAFGQWGTP